MRRRNDPRVTTVATATLAVVTALVVAVVTEGPLSPVQKVFLLCGVALLTGGAAVAFQVARRPRQRLMEGRFRGDHAGEWSPEASEEAE